MITGAYSITHQAIQLGLLPRFEIRHTSAALYGQIYMPRVNMLLLVGVLLLVGLFRTSSELAARLCPCGGGDQPDGDAARLHRDLEAVALAALVGGAADGAVHRRSTATFLLPPADQARARAPGCRCVRRR